MLLISKARGQSLRYFTVLLAVMTVVAALPPSSLADPADPVAPIRSGGPTGRVSISFLVTRQLRDDPNMKPGQEARQTHTFVTTVSPAYAMPGALVTLTEEYIFQYEDVDYTPMGRVCSQGVSGLGPKYHFSARSAGEDTGNRTVARLWKYDSKNTQPFLNHEGTRILSRKQGKTIKGESKWDPKTCLRTTSSINTFTFPAPKQHGSYYVSNVWPRFFYVTNHLTDKDIDVKQLGYRTEGELAVLRVGSIAGPVPAPQPQPGVTVNDVKKVAEYVDDGINCLTGGATGAVVGRVGGAYLGAVIGTAVPVLGNIVGAGVGATVGTIGGALIGCAGNVWYQRHS